MRDALGGSKFMKELPILAKNHRTFYMLRLTIPLLDILVHERSDHGLNPRGKREGRDSFGRASGKSATISRLRKREGHDFSRLGIGMTRLQSAAENGQRATSVRKREEHDFSRLRQDGKGTTSVVP